MIYIKNKKIAIVFLLISIIYIYYLNIKIDNSGESEFENYIKSQNARKVEYNLDQAIINDWDKLYIVTTPYILSTKEIKKQLGLSSWTSSPNFFVFSLRTGINITYRNRYPRDTLCNEGYRRCIFLKNKKVLKDFILMNAYLDINKLKTDKDIYVISKETDKLQIKKINNNLIE